MTCWPKRRDWVIVHTLAIIIWWLGHRDARPADSSSIEAERLVPAPPGWRDRA